MPERTIQTIAGPELEGVRLDHFLTARFTYQSRTGWQNIVREGRITVNGIRVRASRRLHAGDVIVFDVEGIEEPEVDPTYHMVLERPEFLVVSKSGMLPVHPSGCYFQNTLLMLMKERYGELYVVNRLDRETSGLVLLARDPGTAGILSTLFASRQVEKTYLAAVFGEFPAGTVRCDGWLSADPDSQVRKKRRFTADDPGTEDAETCSTEFTRIMTCGGYSLVADYPSLFISDELIPQEVIYGKTFLTDVNGRHSYTRYFHSSTLGQQYSGTKDLVRMFLKLDGTPITEAEAQQSILTEFNGRDTRLAATVLGPGRKILDASGKPANETIDFTFCKTGYQIVKWSIPDASHFQNSIDESSISLGLVTSRNPVSRIS